MINFIVLASRVKKFLFNEKFAGFGLSQVVNQMLSLVMISRKALMLLSKFSMKPMTMKEPKRHSIENMTP